MQHKDSLDIKDFPKELQGIVRVLYQHHQENQAGIDLSLADLSNLFFAGQVSLKDKEFYQKVFEQLDRNDSSASSVQELISSILRGNLLRDLSLKAYETAEGRGKWEDVLKQIEQLQQVSQTVTEDNLDVEFVSTDLEVLINKVVSTPGLRWRLNTLNKMLGSVKKGTFGFIFARPETGKTTFLASEVTHMAEQISDDAGPVLWFNNEQEGEQVMLRCYQSALNLTMTDLQRDLKGYARQFDERIHGRLKLYDSGSIHKKTVEKLCEKLRPSIIIFDQIDKIQGFESDREDLRLGTIYQWARELAKKYAPVIGVCQADGTGEGQRWLTMANVANAKTAKQAEADFILGIGKVNDVGFDSIRYLHLSKNKLIGDVDTDPSLRHGRMECLLDAERGRYVDIT